MLSRLPEQAVSREIRTMTAAGATTVHLLTWLCHPLGEQPEIQRKLRRELLSRIHQEDDAHPIPTLEGCVYLNAVIHEGLRLYPPAPYLLRQAAATIAGEAEPDLPALSSLVLISVFLTRPDREVVMAVAPTWPPLQHTRPPLTSGASVAWGRMIIAPAATVSSPSRPCDAATRRESSRKKLRNKKPW